MKTSPLVVQLVLCPLAKRETKEKRKIEEKRETKEKRKIEEKDKGEKHFRHTVLDLTILDLLPF